MLCADRCTTMCHASCQQVSLTSLREADGPLDAVEAQLQKLLKDDAEVLPAKELALTVRSVIQGLRLYACVFRSSLRRQVTACHASISV